MIHLLPLLMILLSMTLMLGSHFFLILPSLLTIGLGLSLDLMMMGATWLGLIVVMVYIGGMMVLFTYFLTLSKSRPMLLKYSLAILPLLTISWDYSSYTSLSSTPEQMMNLFLFAVFIFSVLWLFLAMIVVVKVTFYNEGPLRMYAF